MGTSRTRSQGVITRPQMRNHWLHCDGSTTHGAYFDGPMTGTMKITSDVVTPNFHQVQKLGGIINNPFTSTETSYSGSESGYSHRYNPVPGSCPSGEHYWSDSGWLSHPNWLGQLGADYAINPDDIASAIAVAQTKALAGVSPADFETLVNLGELPQTLKMIKHPIGLLDKQLGSASFLKKVEALGSLYLMGRYGIRPLVNEISKGIELLMLHHPPAPKRETSRGSAQLSATKSYTAVKTVSGTYALTAQYAITDQLHVRAGVLYANMLEYDRLRVWGVLPHHLPSALWELLPMSFVYDWFANIADFLAAITPKIGVQELANWTTVERVTTVTRTTTSEYLITSPGWSSSQNPSGVQTMTVVSKTRTPNSVHATLTFHPQNKVVGDVWKTLDLAAIINQRIRPKLLKVGLLAGLGATLTSY